MTSKGMSTATRASACTRRFQAQPVAYQATGQLHVGRDQDDVVQALDVQHGSVLEPPDPCEKPEACTCGRTCDAPRASVRDGRLAAEAGRYGAPLEEPKHRPGSGAWTGLRPSRRVAVLI